MVRSETWYTSDLHIGHRLVAHKRGFRTVEDHDSELARRWDAIVSPEDKVWVLGDLSGGGRKNERMALAWLSDRPGTKHLIAGNHDSVHPMHADAHLSLAAFMAVFASVQQSACRRLGGEEVLLSHFPYRELCHPDDGHGGFDQWRLPFLGSWLLHGHIHARTRLHARNIHVGLDAWSLAPVSINAIAQLLNKAAKQ